MSTDYRFIYCGQPLKSRQVFTGKGPFVRRLILEKISINHNDGVLPFVLVEHMIDNWDRVVAENVMMKQQIEDLRDALKQKLDSEKDAE